MKTVAVIVHENDFNVDDDDDDEQQHQPSNRSLSFKSPPDIVVDMETSSSSSTSSSLSGQSILKEIDKKILSNRNDIDLCSINLLDEMIIMDQQQQQQPLQQQQEMPRKLSNSSIRRRLSGCLRKQDSHECPILNVDNDNVDDDDDDDNDNKSTTQTTKQKRKLSWYRRASKIINRQRSVSEDHGHHQSSKTTKTKKSASTSNFELPNIVIAPGQCRYSFSIGDNNRGDGSDSTIFSHSSQQQPPQQQPQEPKLPRNRNMEISSLLTNASKRFLTASFNDLMLVPFHSTTTTSSSASSLMTTANLQSKSFLNKPPPPPPPKKSRSKSSSYTDASILNNNNNNRQQRLSLPRPSTSKSINIVHSDSNLILINNNHNHNRKPFDDNGDGTGKTGDKKQQKQSGAVDALVDRILREEGLGKYIDSGVIRAAQQELAEVCDLTPEGLIFYLFDVCFG